MKIALKIPKARDQSTGALSLVVFVYVYVYVYLVVKEKSYHD